MLSLELLKQSEQMTEAQVAAIHRHIQEEHAKAFRAKVAEWYWELIKAAK